MAENKQDVLNASDNGWRGRILRADFSSEIITELDTQPYAERF